MSRSQRRDQPIKTVRLVIGNGLHVTVPASPWCDCPRPGFGFTKRSDGAWVRPCCMRRTKQTYEKFGDGPIPPAEVARRIGVPSGNSTKEKS